MLQPTNDGVSLWQSEANCVGIPGKIFFSDESEKKGLYKEFCNGCSVKSECLEYALVYDLSGIWGGTTDKDRRRVSKINKAMLRDDYIESGLYNQALKEA